MSFFLLYRKESTTDEVEQQVVIKKVIHNVNASNVSDSYASASRNEVTSSSRNEVSARYLNLTSNPGILKNFGSPNTITSLVGKTQQNFPCFLRFPPFFWPANRQNCRYQLRDSQEQPKENFTNIKALFTRDILAHNIAKKDKKILR